MVGEPFTVNVPTRICDNGSLPIHYACQCGSPVKHSYNDGSLPIHLASRWRSPEFCQVLVDAAPDSIRSIDNYGWSPLHVLCGVAEVDGVNGTVLESIRAWAYNSCRYLECITLPLKDDMIDNDNIFQGCVKLNHVDLVAGVHETVAAYYWRNGKMI